MPRARNPRTNAALIAATPYSFFMTRSFNQEMQRRAFPGLSLSKAGLRSTSQIRRKWILGILADDRRPFADAPSGHDPGTYVWIRLRKCLSCSRRVTAEQEDDTVGRLRQSAAKHQ